MSFDDNKRIDPLLFVKFDASSAELRLKKLSEYLEQRKTSGVLPPQKTDYVNNHIHTTYSFSPYSPTDAVYRAWINGLTTAGIMDHDSAAGGEEFIAAGKALGIATTVGFECRCSMAGTPFFNRRLNNPDQVGIAYVACHGIPHQNIQTANEWLAPYRKNRNERNVRMVDRINALFHDDALQLDFERDILPLSQYPQGGSVTERHLLYALAQRLVALFGRGLPVLQYLSEHLQYQPDEKTQKVLLNEENECYLYSLLGVLKSNIVGKFYIDAAEECPSVAEFTAFVESIGAIPAYAYLGDVGDSVTGDKKTQAFEDAYLDEFVAWLAKNGFNAVTYMPTRNSIAQMERLIALCDKYGLFQISGEDINSPTQSFICQALTKPEFRHLIRSTWALIGHEAAATIDIEDGFCTKKTITSRPDINDRIEYFAAIGKKM